jgi:hypothetical protein
MKKKDRIEKDLNRERPAMVENTNERGKLYNRLSNVFMVVFFFIFLFLMETYPQIEILTRLKAIIPMPLLILLGFFSALASIILRKKGRRHASPRFVNLDSPPGILYLRPFSEDTDWRVYYSWGRDYLPTSFVDKLRVLKFSLRLQYFSIRRQAGYEFGEILSELTSDFGKVAAIGEPESPPILGADNVYVSDDNWKEKVLQLASGAKFVILTVGTTPGVIWETDNMLRIVSPSRLLLNIPGGTPAKRRKNYANFYKSVGDTFPKGLPQKLKARVITFGDDWMPIVDTKKQPPSGTSANLAWWMSRVMP